MSGDSANPAGKFPAILVASDQREVIEEIAQKLRPLAHKVVESMSPGQLAKAFVDDDIQLVIIDGALFDITGRKEDHAIRAILLAKRAPIICASRDSPESIECHGLESIAVDVFDLRLSGHLLCAKADTMLRLHRMRSDLTTQAKTIEKLERELRRYLAQMNASTSDLTSFHASVAHDLHAPLRNIDLFNGILMDDHGAQLGDEGKSLLHRIGKNTALLNQRINGLLQLSAIDHSTLFMERLDVTAICTHSIDRLRRLEPDRGITCLIPPGLTLHGDRSLTTLLLDHLLGNAWKFSQRREQARIEVSENAEPGKPSTLIIRDNGVGFNMAYADRLFTPFHRLHGSSEFPGSGIGLALSAHIVRKHGGRIWAEAQVDQGAACLFHYGRNDEPPSIHHPDAPPDGAAA